MKLMFEPASMKCNFIRPDEVGAGTFVLNGDGLSVVVTAGQPPQKRLLHLTDREGDVKAALLDFRTQIDGIAIKPEGFRILLNHPLERIDDLAAVRDPPPGALFIDESGPGILCGLRHYKVLVNLITWHAADFAVHDTMHGVGKWSLTADGVAQDRQELFRL